MLPFQINYYHFRHFHKPQGLHAQRYDIFCVWNLKRAGIQVLLHLLFKKKGGVLLNADMGLNLSSGISLALLFESLALLSGLACVLQVEFNRSPSPKSTHLTSVCGALRDQCIL